MIKSKLSLIILTFLIILFILSCNNPTEQDTDPPSVTIINPKQNSTVSELVNVTCIATDNKGISKVELWVDGASESISDNSEPYSLLWNTSKLENNSSHTISVRAYDKSDNKADSDPVKVTIDHSNAYPHQVEILSITYDKSALNIIWQKSKDSDFISYELLRSDTFDGPKFTILNNTNLTDTSAVLNTFDVTKENWYWINVSDSLGFSTLSNGYYIKDEPPKEIKINPIIFNKSTFLISWGKIIENDFESLKLYESLNPDMSDEIELYSTISISDTIFSRSNISIDELRYYRIKVTDYWGLSTLSQVRLGSSYSKIGFLSNRDGDGIYMMDILGNDPIKLISNVGKVFEFLFIPDGSKVVFISNISNNREIFISDLYKNYPINLSNSSGLDENFDISPDGSKLIFQYYVDGTNGYEIYSMNIDGSNKKALTNSINNDAKPRFSFDGSKIVFESGRDGKNGIWMMDSDGSNQIKLTNQDGFSPVFSPDNTKITFMGNSNNGYDIFIMDVDGNNLVNLTNSAQIEYYPVFSADGENICYRREDDGAWNLFLTNISGDNTIRLTDTNGNNWNPQFSNNNTKIIFQSDRTGDWDVYIMDIDGSNQINLTDMINFADFLPRFKPSNN